MIMNPLSGAAKNITKSALILAGVALIATAAIVTGLTILALKTSLVTFGIVAGSILGVIALAVAGFAIYKNQDKIKHSFESAFQSTKTTVDSIVEKAFSCCTKK